MLDRTSVGCEQQNRSNPSVLRQEGGITSRLYSTPSKAVERFRNVDAERQSRARREPNVECTLANPEVRLAPGAHHGRELGPWTKAIGCSDRESGCDSIDRARRGRVRELDHHGSFAEAKQDYWIGRPFAPVPPVTRSEEHTSELQSHSDLVCRLLLEKKKTKKRTHPPIQ